MLFSTAIAFTALLTSSAVASPVRRQQSLKFDLWNEKVRGVNLGGWLLLEPWITPSIFNPLPANVVDEYTLTQQLGPDAAKSLLTQHWNTWITQV